MSKNTTDARTQRAADILGAVPTTDGQWAYYADETGTYWVVDDGDMDLLCDYLDDEDEQISGNAYSHWCASVSGEEMPRGWTPG